MVGGTVVGRLEVIGPLVAGSDVGAAEVVAGRVGMLVEPTDPESPPLHVAGLAKARQVPPMPVRALKLSDWSPLMTSTYPS